MKTISVDEEVAHLVSNELKNLEDVNYKLTKTESFRQGYVFSGDTVTGPLSIVNVAGLNLPGVKVINTNYYGDNDTAYIRTSPIVEVLDSTDTTVTFKTEGGVYKLEKVLDN